MGRGKEAGREAGCEEGRGLWRSARRINNDLGRLLGRFAEEIASVRVLDPACGSGNFLSVSVQNLPNLLKGMIAFARDVGLSGFFPSVSPEQVQGEERLCT